MADDAKEQLILRHLDGSTTQQEGAQVTRLLAEDAEFRSRFFSFATLITELQDTLSLSFGGTMSRTIPQASSPAMLALSMPKPGQADKPADGLNSTIDLRQIYFTQRNMTKGLATLDLLLAIPPRSPELLRERALVRLNLEHHLGAAQDLGAYLLLCPEAPDADDVRETLDMLRQLLTRLN